MGRRKKTVTMFAEPVIKTTRSLVYKYRCSACGNTIGIEDQMSVKPKYNMETAAKILLVWHRPTNTKVSDRFSMTSAGC